MVKALDCGVRSHKFESHFQVSGFPSQETVSQYPLVPNPVPHERLPNTGHLYACNLHYHTKVHVLHVYVQEYSDDHMI